MPKDNIERAIQRGGGGADGVSYESILYEGYGPAGVAIIVEVLTDNKNRSAADIRNTFGKHGGQLAQPGAVAWVFERRGSIVVDGEKYSEDDVMAAAIDAGADDVVAGRRGVPGPHPAGRFRRRARCPRGRRHRVRARPSSP